MSVCVFVCECVCVCACTYTAGPEAAKFEWSGHIIKKK